MSHLTDRLNEAEERGAGRGQAVVLGFASVFILYLLLMWASQALSQRPGIALILNPWNASALLNSSEAAMQQDPPDFQAARGYAERALRADPLAPGVHRTLAIVAKETDDRKFAIIFDHLAAQFARDGGAQFSALQRALLDRDFEEATKRVDLLFRGQPQGLWLQISQALANAIANPEFAAPLARKLGEDPPWRGAFLGQVFMRATSVEALKAFYYTLPSPRDPETRQLLERLGREGRYDVAHEIFSRMLPPDRLAEAKLLYNARFQYGVSNVPFDWVITEMPNTLTEVRRDRNRRSLAVSFFGGRTPYRNVNHLMALAPGAYMFSGSEQATSFDNPRGMRWRIFCVNRPDENLGASNLLAGDVPERRFAVSFTVAPDCPFQNLQLELAFRVALEQEATGAVVYTDLSVAAAPQ
jgi:hypothetical protein